MQICPECGYALVPDDRALKDRRAVFLELTRVQAVAIPLALVLLALWFGYGIPLVQLGPAIIAGFALGKQEPTLQRRLLRRVWFVLLGWMSAWWLLLCGGIVAARMLYFDGWYMDWYSIPKWLSLKAGRDGGFGGLTVPFLILLAALGSYLIWCRRWRRLCKTAGFAKEVKPTWMPGILRWSFLYPSAFIALAVLLGIGFSQVMDRFFPGWDMPP
jgi:hypothetical protein